MSGARKPLHFMGSSHADLKAFPDEARRDAGFNLDFVQRGLEPELEADEDCGHGGQRDPSAGSERGLSGDLFGLRPRIGLRSALLSEKDTKDESTRY
jgi:hypothetical protein